MNKASILLGVNIDMLKPVGSIKFKRQDDDNQPVEENLKYTNDLENLEKEKIIVDWPGASEQSVYGKIDDNLENWTWIDAQYYAPHTESDYDEYVGSITVQQTGTFKVAFRFKTGDDNWVYADTDGVMVTHKPLHN